MMKTKLLSIFLAIILSLVFFPNKTYGTNDGIYNVGIGFDATGFGFYTNLYISDHSAYPTAKYYLFMQDGLGDWTKQEQTLALSPIDSTTWNSFFTPPPGEGKIYLFREPSPGAEYEFLAGVEYNSLTATQGAIIFDDPSASIPPEVLPPWEPPGPEPEPEPEPEVPAAPPVDYGIGIEAFTGRVTQFLIAIAVVSSVFLLPYMGILWASGNPENIKKATEWFFSWMTGLLFLLLSGVIIRVIGVDILNLGT